MSIYRMYPFFSYSVVLLVLPALDDSAQEIDEIIVYGDLRESEIEDVPTSVTVLDEALIRQRNASHFEEMVAAAANRESLQRRVAGAVLPDTRRVGERGPVHRAAKSLGGPAHRWGGLQRDRGCLDAVRRRADRSVSRAPGRPLRRQRAGGTHFAAQPCPRTRVLRTPSPGGRRLRCAQPRRSLRRLALRHRRLSHLAVDLCRRRVYPQHPPRYAHDTNDLDELTWRGKLRIDLSDNAQSRCESRFRGPRTTATTPSRSTTTGARAPINPAPTTRKASSAPCAWRLQASSSTLNSALPMREIRHRVRLR